MGMRAARASPSLHCNAIMKSWSAPWDLPSIIENSMKFGMNNTKYS